MKGGTLQICWHSTKPVLTLDFHPTSGILATGGADNDIKFWLISTGEEKKEGPVASYQTSVAYHNSAVNVLRFSHAGDLLASGADGGELVIWKPHSTDSGDTWKFLRALAFHRKDVLDLQWSIDGAFLLSGSVDNSCIIWDVNKGGVLQILDGHSHYVQGVTWDPLGKFVASLSSDRTCRIYGKKPSKAKGNEKMHYICQHVIAKAEAQVMDDSKSAKDYIFHDETLPSFFRRLEWSPDGSFLLVPAGLRKYTSASTHVNTAYVFSRKDLSRPALMLPGASKPVVAVRFCPKTFNLQGLKSSDFFKLPYRLIFAVATLNSLYIYDTEGIEPIAVLAGIHYAAITDIAWSPNGEYLAVSSQDGYCSLVEFENGELGSPIPLAEKKTTGHEQSSPLVVCNTKAEVVENVAVAVDIEKEKTETMEEPQSSVTAVTTPTTTTTTATAPPRNQPARRRITPMAID